MPPDDDRAAILRRRAFFVTSALSATLAGCPPERPVPQPDPPVATVEPGSGPLPTAATTGSAPEPTAKLPPLEVPDDVSDAARAHFEGLVRDVPPIHQELDAAAKELSNPCPIEEAACKEHWEKIAGHLAQAKDALADLGPRCPGSSEDAKRFDEVLAAHTAVLRGRLERLEREIARELATEPEKAQWKQFSEAAAVPRPCLKFACEDW